MATPLQQKFAERLRTREVDRQLRDLRRQVEEGK